MWQCSLHEGFVCAVVQCQQALGLVFALAAGQVNDADAEGLGDFGVYAVAEGHDACVYMGFQQLGGCGFAGVVVAGDAKNDGVHGFNP